MGEKAKEILESQANELVAKMDFTEINVDAKYHKHIIGKGGSTVNKLKQDTEELEALVAKMQNEREKDLIIEARFHRELIGAKGGNIQKIRDDFAAVQISFPDLGSKSDI